jgi:hypothetical protein
MRSKIWMKLCFDFNIGLIGEIDQVIYFREIINEKFNFRLFPKFTFDDSLSAIEKLWKKRELQVHMQRYRLDQLMKDEEKIVDDEDDEMQPREEYVDAPMDEFEALIDEQIALSRTNNNAEKTMNSSFGNMSSISGIEANRNISHFSDVNSQIDSQSSQSQTQINDELRAKIAENRRKALEIMERKKKEKEAAEELEKKSSHTQEISNFIIDDD